MKNGFPDVLTDKEKLDYQEKTAHYIRRHMLANSLTLKSFAEASGAGSENTIKEWVGKKPSTFVTAINKLALLAKLEGTSILEVATALERPDIKKRQSNLLAWEISTLHTLGKLDNKIRQQFSNYILEDAKKSPKRIKKLERLLSLLIVMNDFTDDELYSFFDLIMKFNKSKGSNTLPRVKKIHEEFKTEVNEK